MKLNTVIKLPDGRVGTICWNHLDGAGGVWGEQHFEMPEGGFGDLPSPEFMLREPKVKEILVKIGHLPNVECVGNDFEIIREGN
ncbi:hypothetical protein LCGC14_0474170 [marine sediment metagenome]|uniref:Uncharacterized protein n=1 Tax=marine sediment metagenome TaxID=412755 RepID=A0A0F9SU19_9ZZZZ